MTPDDARQRAEQMLKACEDPDATIGQYGAAELARDVLALLSELATARQELEAERDRCAACGESLGRISHELVVVRRQLAELTEAARAFLADMDDYYPVPEPDKDDEEIPRDRLRAVLDAGQKQE